MPRSEFFTGCGLQRNEMQGKEVNLIVNQTTPEYVQFKYRATIPRKTLIWTTGVHGESFIAEFPTIRKGQVNILPITGKILNATLKYIGSK
jgi:NADH dehydrogenase FAD-containing subunit